MHSNLEAVIQHAIEAASASPATSVRKIAAAYGVNRCTLTNRMNGGISKSDARAAQQLLSPEQEEKLAEWILTLEADGHAPTRTTVRGTAAHISAISGGSSTIGHHWLQRFFTRNPEVHTKISKRIDTLRARNANAVDLNAWFTLFQTTLTSNSIATKDVWNMDESGLALGVSKHQLVLGSSQSTRVYKKTPKNRE